MPIPMSTFNPPHSRDEWTYLMLISKLLKDVGEDKGIPNGIKSRVLKKIDQIQTILEPFSA